MYPSSAPVRRSCRGRHSSLSGNPTDHRRSHGGHTMSAVTIATRTLPAASQRITPAKFAHFVLKTASFDAVISWYATVLQARVAHRDDFIAFLTYDDEHHRDR